MCYKTMFNCLWQILKVDLLKFVKYSLFDDIINKLCWVTCSLVIATYVWPQIGMSTQFGSFMAIGTIVACMFWDCWGLSMQFVADLEGNRVIEYYLSLPVTATGYFTKQIVCFAIRSAISAVIVIPFMKIMLWNSIDFSKIAIIQFLIVFVAASFFCASLALMITSMVKDMHSTDNISIRFLFPMYFFGGSQFSWHTLHAVAPGLSYAALINPLMYAMEAMHVAFLGQADYLPFWASIFMLLLFTVAFSWIGTRRLIKRLDCV